MMARYRAVLANTRPPRIVGFNVSGTADDYRILPLCLHVLSAGRRLLLFHRQDAGV